jgi:hypothetical protein
MPRQALKCRDREIPEWFGHQFRGAPISGNPHTTARTAEIRAADDYNKILAQLAFAEGTILERHHLSLEVK